MDVQFRSLCKMLVKHFEAAQLFTSDTKYFDTNSRGPLPSCTKPQLRILLNNKERSTKQVRPLKRHETRLLPTSKIFHRMNLESIFLLFSKLPLGQVFSIKSYDGSRWSLPLTKLTWNMQERTFLPKMEKRRLCITARRRKCFAMRLWWHSKKENVHYLAFFPVLLGQKRKDTGATLLKFVQGLHLKPRLIVMDGGFAVAELFRHLDDAKLAWTCQGNRMKKREYPSI